MNAIVPRDQQDNQAQETVLTRISNYLDKPVIRSRFADILGAPASRSYINQVLLAVANSEDLKECELQSIYTSALTIATLRLSVDPSVHEAYIVAKGKHAEPWVSYKGLYDMAMRTGKYRYINVGPIYKGEFPIIDRLSGIFRRMEGAPDMPKVKAGWLAAFEYVPDPKGQHIYACLYMTIEEIHAHAIAHNPGGYKNQKMPWQKNEHTRESMEAKTVLKILLNKKGYIDPNDASILASVGEWEQPDNDAEKMKAATSEIAARGALAPSDPDGPEPLTGVVVEKRTREQNLSELGFKDEQKNPDSIDDKSWDPYLALCDRAEEVNIPYNMPERAQTTKADLRAEYDGLLKFVKDAEEQMRAGAETQDDEPPYDLGLPGISIKKAS